MVFRRNTASRDTIQAQRASEVEAAGGPASPSQQTPSSSSNPTHPVAFSKGKLGGCIDKSIFQYPESISSSLLCGINMGVMEAPVRTPCDHLFCEYCLRQWLGYNSTCPTCRSELANKDIKRDRNIENIINDLQVPCSGAVRGCVWVGRIEDLRTHCKECAHILLQCPYKGCGGEFERKDLDNHRRRCDFHVSACKYCHTAMERRHHAPHLEQCALAPVPCPMGCGVESARCRVPRHLKNDCPNAPAPCPFSKHGCTVQVGRRQDIEAHITEHATMHMLLVAKALDKVEGEVADLRTWRKAALAKNIRHGKPHVRVLKGHADSMNCFQFDDNILVSGSLDKTVRVWDLKTFECIRELKGHTATVWCCEYRGDILVSGSGDATCRVWSISSGECLHTLTGHAGDIYCLGFDGERAATGSRDGTLRVWDPLAGSCLMTLNGHTDYVLALRMHGSTMVSASADNSLRLWSMDTAQCLQVFEGHKDSVWCMQMEGSTLASGSDDNTVRIWDMDTGKCKHELRGHTDHVYCIQLLGNLVCSGSDDKTLRLWDISTGQCQHELVGHDESVWCLEMDTNTLTSGSGDGTLCIWDVKDGRLLQKLTGHSNTMIRVHFIGNRVVTCSSDGTLRVWDFDDSRRPTIEDTSGRAAANKARKK